MADATPTPIDGRRRRPWLAFLLNFVFPPGGYFYVGFPKIAVIGLSAFLSAAMLLFALTIIDPPGVYAIPIFWRGDQLSPLLLIVGWSLSGSLAIHAAILCRRPSRSTLSGLKLWLCILIVAPSTVVLAGLNRIFGPISIYVARNASMAPNLVDGDIFAVLGARAICGQTPVRPGDVVIVKDPKVGGFPVLKRAIASAGHVVETKGDALILDGTAAPHSFVETIKAPASAVYPVSNLAVSVETLPNNVSYKVENFSPTSHDLDMAPLRIPSGNWFVVGDNRGDSLDSRSYGPIPSNHICGVAFKILYSKDKARIGLRP